ncbi:MAG: hypothetical protein J6R82_05370 [Clostridia bacterium]|nr:hypothetical protein [Clostridia bacterium]
MTEMNISDRPTTREHRGLCVSNALFWTLTITLPMWTVIAVIWYGIGLINDDGGAAIAGPAVLLTGVSLIVAIILSAVRRKLRLEKLQMSPKRRRMDLVMLYALPAMAILLPAEVIGVGKLIGNNSAFFWIGGGVYLFFFGAVFYLFATGMIYRRQYKRRTFIEFGIMLVHGTLYVWMLQSLSLYLSLMIVEAYFINLSPWILVFILLFGISCSLLRRYVIRKEQ